VNTSGLATDQAPPFAVPLAWYAIAPVAAVAGGAVLLGEGGRLLYTGWLPATAALTHLATLGVVGAAMAGSLYQMAPVVAGSPVPWPRLGHAVAACWAIGLGGLAIGLGSGRPALLRWAIALLAAAFVGFAGPVGWAVARAAVRSPTVTGMRLALASLAVAVALGLRLAWGFAGGEVPASRHALLVAHMGIGAIGWVGGLWMAVGWQVVPMFWMTAGPAERPGRWQLAAVGGSVGTGAGLAVSGLDWAWVAGALAPAALSVWLVQPVRLAALLRGRRRKRPDPALALWWLSLGCAPVALALAVALAWVDWPPLGPLLGWVALWGWAAAAVHAALAKIVPFLAWFHRFAQTAHDAALQAQVPPIKQLLPDRQVRIGLWLHTVGLGLGVLAIVTGVDGAARAAGSALVGCGAALAANLMTPVWRAARAGRSS